MTQRFEDRGYSRPVLNRAINIAESTSRDVLLQDKNKNKNTRKKNTNTTTNRTRTRSKFRDDFTSQIEAPVFSTPLL